MYIIQVRSRTCARGQTADGALRDRTSWPAINVSIQVFGRSPVQTADDLSLDPITSHCTLNDTSLPRKPLATGTMDRQHSSVSYTSSKRQHWTGAEFWCQVFLPKWTVWIPDRHRLLRHISCSCKQPILPTIFKVFFFEAKTSVPGASNNLDDWVIDGVSEWLSTRFFSMG